MLIFYNRSLLADFWSKIAYK